MMARKTADITLLPYSTVRWLACQLLIVFFLLIGVLRSTIPAVDPREHRSYLLQLHRAVVLRSANLDLLASLIIWPRELRTALDSSKRTASGETVIERD